MVNSVHKYTINEVGSSFDVSIVSEDGLIEGIEYNKDDKYLIGVQFHPEVLEQYDNIFKEFSSFVQRGNAIDMAVGIIVGSVMTSVVNSLVKDVIMPPIGLLIGGVDFSQWFFVLGGGEPGVTYETIAQAQAAGVPAGGGRRVQQSGCPRAHGLYAGSDRGKVRKGPLWPHGSHQLLLYGHGLPDRLI
mgnify:CR=1 FL=1